MLTNPDAVGRIGLGLLIASAAFIGLPARLRADRAGGRISIRDDPPWFWIGMLLLLPPMAFVCGAFLLAPDHLPPGGWTAPLWTRAAGWLVGALGTALFAWMFRHLGLNVTSTASPRAKATLVETGPYRYVRHPMYSAVLLLVVAATLLTAHLVVAVGGLAMFALLAARSRLEEQRLVDRFGAAYVAYQARTGRFIPRRGCNHGGA